MKAGKTSAREAAPSGVRDAALLGLILLGGLGLRLWLVAATPPLFAPDEASHLLYAHSVAMRFQFPTVGGDLYWAQTHGSDAFFHPPLFYLVATPFYRLGLLWPDGPVYTLRLLNVGFSLALVAVIYAIAATLFRGRPAVALLAAMIAGWLPSVAANGAAVNNDILANLLIAVTIGLAIRSITQRRVSVRLMLAIAAAGAAAQYTKSTAVIVLPCLLLAAWLLWRRQVPHWWFLALAAALIVLIASPWWVFRNVATYGDPLGLSIPWPTDHRSLTVRASVFVEYLMSTYWLVFGRTNEVRASNWYFVLPLPFVVLASARLYVAARSGRLTEAGTRDSVLLLGLLFVTTLAGFVKFGLDHGQGQGRYLFPALPATCLALSFGLCDLWQRREGFIAALLGAGIALYGASAVATVALPAFARVHVVVLTSRPLPFAGYQAGDYSSWVRYRQVPYRIPVSDDET